MAFDLFLFSDAATARATITQIKAAADADRTIDGQNNLKVPVWSKLAAAYAMGATLGQAQLQSGKLGSIAFHNIEPIEVGTTPSSNPPFADYFDNPIPLDQGESLGAYGVNFASEINYLAVWLADMAAQRVTGPFRTLRCTGTTTLSAAAWKNVPLTLPSNLKAGTYRIIGARFHSATGVLGRLRIPGYAHHPGAIAFSTVVKVDPLRFRYGNAGEWGTFVHDSPPTADFYASGADTAETVLLDVIGPA